MKKLIILVLALIAFTATTAHARIYIPIDQPADQKFPIAIPDISTGMGKKIADIIRNDMTLSGYFRLIPISAIKAVAKKEGITAESMNFSFWKAVEAQGVVKGEVKRKSGKLMVTLRLFDPYLGEMLVGKQYKADKKHLREIAHRFSDEIMEALTGIRGVFNTKIAYSAVTGKGRKEIFVMDMDGFNPAAITKNKSINISPSWSPDGKQLVFTSYMRGNPDLYIMKLGGRGLRKISPGSGSNITPAWQPTGKLIAFASSVKGTSNLYTIAARGRKMRPLTRSSTIDIAPSWAPDGQQLVFSSERAGGLHLFRTSLGGGVNRLTYVGYQNDMPDWSPMGDKIVFAGRDMGAFDIFIMNDDGSNIQRLTIGAGNNEHPTFSPDGRFVTFSSTREGAASIFMMRADGSNQTRISKGNGLLPSWGPQVK